jgi:hypothetical protein
VVERKGAEARAILYGDEMSMTTTTLPDACLSRALFTLRSQPLTVQLPPLPAYFNIPFTPRGGQVYHTSDLALCSSTGAIHPKQVETTP